MTIPQALELALQRHQAGQLSEAEALYRQVLEAQPNHSGALHLLGVIAHQSGRPDLAVERIRQAIVLDPNNPAAYSNLGEACRVMGRFEEAIAACRRALALKPDYPNAHLNLGNALRDRGGLDEAVAAYRRALELKPDYQEAHNNLGIALTERGQMDEALAACRRAVELKPGCPEAHNNTGNALGEQGQLDEAIAAYRRAVELKPDFPEVHNNLGGALRKRGQLDEATAAYRRALELKPDYPEAHNNLGDALLEAGRFDEALACFRRAMAINPAFSAAHSNLILNLHYAPGITAASITAECGRWWARHGAPLSAQRPRYPHDRSPGRRLRLGYVSADFCEHPVARHILPMMREHDTGQFEVVCYSGVGQADAMTERFRALDARWREVAKLNDDELAARIREDKIDILIDLSLHTRGNRLPVFARQPAPVQVSFAGYPGATGLETIAYRLTDRFLEPEASAGPRSAEQPIHLPDSFWCYDVCGVEVAFNPLPALESGTVTFGSLNSFCKVNERVLSLWARVLGRVKDSRLVIRSPAGSHRRRTLETLEREGVEARRVDFVETRPRREYLESYHRLDIVLDTFPYNGHVTACDALWMGVPVVSLAGETPVSRGGLSLLSNVGLPELVAFSEDEYVRIAVELAGDLPRLAALRAGLRARMRASPLMDAPRFARQVEQAYREMWEAWRKV